MRDLAVLIPTRGRPANIRKVISAWDFTNAWDDADMVLVIDADDPEYQGYLDIVNETRHPDTDDPLVKVYAVPTWRAMVHKLDEAAVELAPGWFALGFAGDDHLPQTINWAKTYLATLRELETGLVHSDDGYQHENICTEWAVTSDVVTALGRMIPAPVEHMYSDVSLHEVMAEAGALRYLPQVRIEHMHPIVKKAPDDEQYKRVNSREQFAADKRLYDGWRNGRKSADLAAVKALRPDRIQPVRRGQILRNRPGAAPVQKRSGPRGKTMAPKHPFPFSREFQNVRGATPDEIGMTLADFALRVPADQEIVELGVFQGRTALIMAWGAKQGHGAHVTGIDAWDLEGNTYGPPFNLADSENWARYRVTELGYSDRVGLIKNFASDAAAAWSGDDNGSPISGKPIGLLFVDDDHDYSGARRAVEDWAPHLAEGAVIAVDDYGHPDWPGVAMAVDDLVAEGVLAPIEIYHERLAVTRLLPGAPDRRNGGAPLAITSEGVSPSPEQIYQEGIESGLSHAEAQGDAWPEPVSDSPVSTWRDQVQPDELAGVTAGTAIGELTIPQLKILARRRNIVLGVRKDKREDILQALADGR